MPQVAVLSVVEEVADAEFRQLPLDHVRVEAEHLAEVVGADLDARFADLVRRFRRRVGALLEHQHAKAGPFLTQLPREREAGQPPAEDDDVVVCLHARRQHSITDVWAGRTHHWPPRYSSGLALAAAFAIAADGGPVALAAWFQAAAGPRFYPDDPVWVDDDRAFDASKAKPIATGDIYDFVEHTFMPPGERVDRPALNVNTLDEVPDSSWFTNRIGRQRPSREALVRGPDRRARPDIQDWPIVAGKSEGAQPGYRVQDPEKHLWQIEFDPPAHPEMASAAEVIGTAIYHALGYNVVEVYIADVDPARIKIAPNARMRAVTAPKGVRSFVQEDLNAVLARAARRPDGRVRVLASRFAEGSPLGSFRYDGPAPRRSQRHLPARAPARAARRTGCSQPG